VGLIDRAKAAARDAQDRMLSAARTSEGGLAGVVGQQRYANARGKVSSSAARAAAGSKKAGGAALDRVGATTGGQRVGDGARRAVKEIQALPLVGLTPEALAARNGVPTLRKKLRRDPMNPEHALWLAEALLRTEREMLVVRIAHGTANPTTLAVRGVTNLAIKLGQPRGDPPHLRLLKAAFAAAATRLRANPSDADALHVCARVYLVQSMFADAARLAELAATAAPTDGRPCATAAHAYLRAGDEAAAAACAEQAVERGCTVGHEVHAELLRRRLLAHGELGVKERSDAYAERLALVDRKDRRAYYGAALGAPGITWAMTAQESRKTARLTGRLAEGTAKGAAASAQGAARMMKKRRAKPAQVQHGTDEKEGGRA
jgi:tetratricopeptide (TPR) repeat protein